MDNLEKYIQDNMEQFNRGEMPEGHTERFMARLAPQKTPRLFSRRVIFAATSAAAAIIIAMVATFGTVNEEDRYTIEVHELAQEMYIEEAQTIMLFEEDEQYMINSIKSITDEAIPLADQLPDELSPEKRAEILREYYKAKTAGLKKIKTLYAQSDEPID